MHFLLIVLAIRLAAALIVLNNENDFESISTDLGEIVHNYQDCFIHIILSEQEVSTASITVPFVLASPRHFQQNFFKEYAKFRASLQDEAFPFTLRKFKCLLTTYVIIESEFHQSAIFCDGFQRFLMTQQGKQIITPHKIIIMGSDVYWEERENNPQPEAQSHCQFERLGAVDLTFYWLLYAKDDEQIGRNRQYKIECALLQADYTPEPLYEIDCQDWEQCLSNLFDLRRVVTKNGHNVLWTYVGMSLQHKLDNLMTGGAWRHCPLKTRRQDSQCSTQVGGWTLYDFLIQSLNTSWQLAALNEVRNAFKKTTPKISWTEEHAEGFLFGFAQQMVIPLQAFPLTSTKAKKESLKFITSDGAMGKIKHAQFYLEPFQLTVWLGLLLVAIAFCLLMLYMATIQDRTIWFSALCESLFWFSGAAVDQIQTLQINTSGTRPSTKRILPAAICIMMLAFFIIGNEYRVVMNANYITQTEYHTSWTRLDQIQNFTIFLPVDKAILASYEEHRRDGLIPLSTFGMFCRGGLVQPVGADAGCLLLSTLGSAISIREKLQGCSKAIKVLLGQAPDAPPYDECPSSHLRTLIEICKKIRFISESDLESYFLTELRRPKTALLVTEASFQEYWHTAEEVMRNDSSIRLVHNYFSPYDTTLIPKKQHMAYVCSGLEPEYMRIVINKIHVLLTAGLWDAWVELSEYTAKLSEYRDGIHVRLMSSSFAPLSIEHDSIYYTTTGLVMVMSGLLSFLLMTVVKRSIPKIISYLIKIKKSRKAVSCSTTEAVQ